MFLSLVPSLSPVPLCSLFSSRRLLRRSGGWPARWPAGQDGRARVKFYLFFFIFFFVFLFLLLFSCFNFFFFKTQFTNQQAMSLDLPKNRIKMLPFFLLELAIRFTLTAGGLRCRWCCVRVGLELRLKLVLCVLFVRVLLRVSVVCRQFGVLLAVTMCTAVCVLCVRMCFVEGWFRSWKFPFYSYAALVFILLSLG